MVKVIKGYYLFHLRFIIHLMTLARILSKTIHMNLVDVILKCFLDCTRYTQIANYKMHDVLGCHLCTDGLALNISWLVGRLFLYKDNGKTLSLSAGKAESQVLTRSELE